MANNLFRYRKTTVSISMVVAFCLALFLQIEYTNRAFWDSQNIQNPILQKSWGHLQAISTYKHPFTSPNNDMVRLYLQNTLSALLEGTEWAKLEKDESSIFINQHDVFNATNDANRLIYYESSNVIVKLEGSDPSLAGLLISAHYDSVPTSFGTIDDGMGIVSMLGALENLLMNNVQPKRTLIFNFNNNEEFGLLGAESFVQSPWFSKVKYFLNLEGTGSGQYTKPILFRGTDKQVLNWYNHVSFPFASSSFMQGFKNGLVRSETDYHVYQAAGLRGIDVAFFEPRSWYHTLRDGIMWTSKGALWMMMKNTIDILAVVAFSSSSSGNNSSESTKLEPSIFFDVFDKYYFNIGIDFILQLSVFLALVFPLVNTFLLLNINSDKKSWFVGVSGWLRLPITMSVTFIITKFLIKHFQMINPLLVSVSYILLIIQFSCISFLVGYTILKLANYLSPVHDQKFHLIIEINAMLWMATIYSIYSLTDIGGQSVACYGVYIPLMYVLSELSFIVGVIGLWARRIKKFDRNDITVEHVSGNNVTSESYSSIQDHEQEEDQQQQQQRSLNDEPTLHNPQGDTTELSDEEGEQSPLIQTEQNSNQDIVITYPTYDEYLKNERKRALKSPQYEWPIQFILLVPIPLYFILREGLLIGLALHETVQESGSFDYFVWNIICFLGVLIGSISWIWSDKMRATLVIFVLFSLIFTNYQLGGFQNINMSKISIQNIDGNGNRPFASEKYPLKMRFVEEFNVNSNSSKAVVYGRSPYVEQILLDTPWIENEISQGNKNALNCKTNNETSMELCEFKGERPWILSGTLNNNLFSNYLNVSILSNTNNGSNTMDKYSPFESIIQINVKGSRQCHLSFNSSNAQVPTPVKAITVYKGDNWKKDMDLKPSKDIPVGTTKDEDGNWSCRVIKGIDDLTLHKLPWSSNGAGSKVLSDSNVFTVKLEWLPFTYDSDFSRIEDLGVSVSCEWSDYEDKVLVSGVLHTRVETLVELIEFAGRDAAFTNLKAGIINGVFDISL